MELTLEDHSFIKNKEQLLQRNKWYHYLLVIVLLKEWASFAYSFFYANTYDETKLYYAIIWTIFFLSYRNSRLEAIKFVSIINKLQNKAS